MTIARFWPAEAQIGPAGPPGPPGSGGGTSPYYLPETYDAVGDGVADDTEAIQAAIDAAHTAGAGTVFLGKRYGWTGDLIHKTGVTVMGAAMSDFATANTGLVALDSTARYRYGLQAGHPYAGPLLNLQIDGATVGGATELVRVEAVNGAIRDVAVVDGAGDGVLLAGAQNCSLDHITVGGFPTGAAIRLRNRDNAPTQDPNTQGPGGNKIIDSYFHSANVLVKQDYYDNGHTLGFWAHDNFFIGCLFEQYQDVCHSIAHIADGEIQFNLCVFTGSSGFTTVSADAVMLVENQIRPTATTVVTLTNCYLGGGAVGVSHLIRSNSYGLANTVRLLGRTNAANAGKGFVLCNDMGGGGLGAIFAVRGPVDGVTLGTGAGTGGLSLVTGTNGGTAAALLAEQQGPVRFRMADNSLGNPIQIRRYADAANRFQITRDGNQQWLNASTGAVISSIVPGSTGLAVSGENLIQLAAFTAAGRPAASGSPHRLIFNTDTPGLEWSDGTNWVPVGSDQTDTTTNLNSAAATVNTTNKRAGKRIFNTTSNRPVWATGSTATSTWVYGDGTTAHTPA